jgi:hypothetical protein
MPQTIAEEYFYRIESKKAQFDAMLAAFSKPLIGRFDKG